MSEGTTPDVSRGAGPVARSVVVNGGVCYTGVVRTRAGWGLGDE